MSRRLLGVKGALHRAEDDVRQEPFLGSAGDFLQHALQLGGTDLLADDVEAMFVIDVRASDLDVSGGFDCFRLTIEGDDLSNTCTGHALYVLYGARYPQATPVSAIVD